MLAHRTTGRARSAAPKLARLGLLLALLLTLGAPPRPARAGPGPSPGQTRIDLPIRFGAPPLTVRAERGLEDQAKRTYRRAPAVLAAIYSDLPRLPRPEAIEVRLVRDAADIGRASPGGARVPEWAAGVAFARAGVVVIAAHRGPDDLGLDETVAHELAHLALGAALSGRAPRWLNEGFAFLHSNEWSVARAQTLTGIAWSGERSFLFELDQSFPERANAASRAYAQSYDFVAFLARRGRRIATDDDGDRRPFRRFLGAIAGGHTVEQAADKAFGRRLQDLEAEWWTQLRERYMWAPVGLFSLFVWFFGAVLLVLAWLRRRYQARQTLARWAADEAAADEAESAAHQRAPDWLH